MANSMTIEGVKKAKVDLELEVTKLFKSFEKKTGTRLGYMNIRRTSDRHDEVMSESSSKKKAIKTVDINMDIDVI